MQRRTFLKSAFSVAAAVPLVNDFPVLRNQAATQQKEPLKISLYDESLPEQAESIEIDGIGAGIPAIDEITNGFFPRQLVLISSPLNSISLTFLMDVAVHVALVQHKTVDFVASESNARKLYEGRFSHLRPKNRMRIDAELFTPEKSYGRPLLRFLDCDLGNPDNLSWQRCVQEIRSQPPTILILDGIDGIQEFLGEQTMPEQLKQLATDLHIPLLVRADLQQSVTRTDEEESFKQTELENRCDVSLAMIPQYVCDLYSEGDKRSKRYYVLKTFVNGFWCPCSKHEGYGAELQLQFIEYFNESEGRSIPSTFSE